MATLKTVLRKTKLANDSYPITLRVSLNIKFKDRALKILSELEMEKKSTILKTLKTAFKSYQIMYDRMHSTYGMN
jgi:hypothetical protein